MTLIGLKLLHIFKILKTLAIGIAGDQHQSFSPSLLRLLEISQGIEGWCRGNLDVLYLPSDILNLPSDFGQLCLCAARLGLRLLALRVNLLASRGRPTLQLPDPLLVIEKLTRHFSIKGEEELLQLVNVFLVLGKLSHVLGKLVRVGSFCINQSFLAVLEEFPQRADLSFVLSDPARKVVVVAHAVVSHR